MSRIISVRIGEDLRIDDMDISLDSMKAFVGGYIQCLQVADGVNLWLNDDGKAKGLDVNILLLLNGEMYDMVVGDAFFTSNDDEGNTTGLKDEDIKEVFNRMKRAIINDGQLVYALEMGN